MTGTFSVEQAEKDDWKVEVRISKDEPWMVCLYHGTMITGKHHYVFRDCKFGGYHWAPTCNIRNITRKPEPVVATTWDRDKLLAICNDPTLGAPQARAAIRKLLDPQAVVADVVQEHLETMETRPESVEHVVAIQVYRSGESILATIIVKGMANFKAGSRPWALEPILPRTEITFDTTGHVIGQVMADGEVIDFTGLLKDAQKWSGAAIKLAYELATLKAAVLKDLMVYLTIPSFTQARRDEAIESIKRLCQPDDMETTK